MNAAREKEIIITNRILATLVVVGALALGLVIGKQQGWVNRKPMTPPESRIVKGSPLPLPSPDLKINDSLNQALKSRVSRYQFLDQKMTLQQLSQLSWAMQGITTAWGDRTTPTVKASYPLEISVIVRNVDGISNGIYLYQPDKNELIKIDGYDETQADQIFKNTPSFLQAGAVFVLTGNVQKMNHEIKESDQYQLMLLEAGGALQNLLLEAESLNLGANYLTEFPIDTNAILKIPTFEQLFAIIPVGYPMSK